MNDDRIQQVMQAMSKVEDPELHKDMVSLNMIRDVAIENDDVSLTVVLTTPACPMRDEITRRVTDGLNTLGWVDQVNINMTADVRSDKVPAAASLPGVKNALAVASGKGGVGKSTVSVNLAVALARHGASVGILDADVYGPNIPLMMGAQGDPVSVQGKIQPLEAHGIKLMSLGFMLEEGTPVIWRGPMIGGALKQLTADVDWGDIDYLIVDLPPGTGDASLSLAQLVPLVGAVVVSTPQEVALQDVRRSISMFERLSVDVLGIVENMSYYLHDNGDRVEIFGHGGAKDAAEHLQLPFLGEIPLSPTIREGGDSGNPVTSNEASPLGNIFMDMSAKIAASVSVKMLEKVEPLPML